MHNEIDDGPTKQPIFAYNMEFPIYITRNGHGDTFIIIVHNMM